MQSGAFYHKCGGGNLVTPQGKPQEYGIVRVADKISYSPWDLFDSIANGYIRKEEVPKELFDILGQDAMEWITRLVKAVVRESAEAHRVQFTEKSGELYHAFKKSRDFVYERVHEKIDWTILEAQMSMSFEKIMTSFPEIDPVAVLGYITDVELGRLTSLIESQPKNIKLTVEDLKKLGFGFYEIIEILMADNFDPSALYYNSSIDLDI